MPETDGGGNPFWDFSLARYARPGVAEACIGLQDRLGVDVNLLLFCGWAGHRGHRLSAAEIERLLSTSAPWQDEIVRPLRTVRRRLKRDETASAAIAALRDKLKALELEAERIAQDRLQACLPLAAGSPSDEAIQGNLALYLEHLSTSPREEDNTALERLRVACL